MSTLLAAIDCGTTAVKCALIDLDGRLASCTSRSTPCAISNNGHIETDPDELLRAVFAGLKEAVEDAGGHPAQIEALSLSTQRATVLAVDRGGTPLGRAISWQDMRGTEEIEHLRGIIDDDRYYQITGLPNNPVFSLGKLLWIKNQAPEIYRRTARFVLIHDYVLQSLGCDDYYCDLSNASLTGVLDSSRLVWSPEIIEAAGLSADLFSVLKPSGTIVGTLSAEAARYSGLTAGIPLITGGGDQQCAGLGAGAIKPGIIEFTLGTAGVTLCFSDRVIRPPRRRVTCCVHAMPGTWEVEGLQNSAGASLQWLAGIMGIKAPERERWHRSAAMSSPGAGGLLFYPYLIGGSSAPHWNPHASALFFGLTHNHGPADMVRAVMEGVTMETRQVLEVVSSLKIPIEEIRLTGGYTSINLWNQIQADIFGRPVSTLENHEASLMGAALLGAVGINLYPSIPAAAQRMVRTLKTYHPDDERSAKYQNVYARYRAVQAAVDPKLFQIGSRRSVAT